MEGTMNDIINFGIVNFALKQDFYYEDIARQLLYDFHRGKPLKKAKSLTMKLLKSGELKMDCDFEGLPHHDLYDEHIQEVVRVLKLYPDFLKIATLNCQLSNIDKFFNIESPDNDTKLERYENTLKSVDAHEAKFGKDPYPSIDKSLAFDFRDDIKDSELFAGYIAIRSLIGQHRYTQTTRSIILMRMFGAKSKEVLKMVLKDDQLKNIYDKYGRSTKALQYNFNKLFARLLKRGLLSCKIFERSISRKIFLSCSLNYSQLSDEIVKHINKQDHKRLEADARQKIKQGLLYNGVTI